MVGMRKLSFGYSEERPYLDCAIPDCPRDGIRVRVCYAGLCYVPSISNSPLRKGCAGYRNGNFFEGFEISGVIECIGESVLTHDLSVGDPVAVFPDAEITEQGYADFVVVRKLNNIVKLPSSISLAVGAMLPTGGTLAMSTVIHCQKYLEEVVNAKGHCNIVIFGAGSLTHWLIRLLRYSHSRIADRIHIIVASDDWEGLKIAQKLGAEEVLFLGEDCHEQVLVERMKGYVRGGIQMSICLAHDERLQKRSAGCLMDGGVLVIPEFSLTAESDLVENKQLRIVEVPKGTAEDLRTLVRIISQGQSLQANQPAYKIYPVESSQRIFEEMQMSDINERPVLEFETADSVFT
ncbi:uncharacterized protein LOC129585952 isoform X2 [Paramacrobiotus metropolitanus]|nr:uncharacterized protein LOC129585952 isoform X2 [Paramacrobiotus metropolitanus]